MIYKDIFNLTGTLEQQEIVKEALDKVFFPWDKLNFPNKPVEIGWSDLNEQTGTQLKVSTVVPEPLMGMINGRRYTLGVFYPGEGSIFIDNNLTSSPDQAKTTVSAEIAHSCDEFLPLTDEQRNQIIKLVDPTGYAADTWWEKLDYNAEYFSLVGEVFMILFTYAYTDMPFASADAFKEHTSPEMASAIRSIIGIERTDMAPTEIPLPQPSSTSPVVIPPSTILEEISNSMEKILGAVKFMFKEANHLKDKIANTKQ